jgi:hypothetical protein
MVLAVPFAMTAGQGRRSGNPAFQTVALMTHASLIDLAPVFGSTPESLLLHLQQRGYQVTSVDQSPSAIADASAVSANEVLFSMMSTPPAAKVDKG